MACASLAAHCQPCLVFLGSLQGCADALKRGDISRAHVTRGIPFPCADLCFSSICSESFPPCITNASRKMGKGTDKLYITHSEWASSDAFSASVGAGAGSRAQRPTGANFKRLPFNFCAASLQPFRNPVCTPEGTIFDVEIVGAWLEKHNTNPVNGKPLDAKNLIKLNFARNADAEVNPNAGPTDGKGDMSEQSTPETAL